MTFLRGLTPHGENLALDSIFGSGSPASIFVGLAQTIAGDTPAGEPTIGSNGYARVEIVNNATHWPAASGGAKVCQQDVIFPVSTGAWASGASLLLCCLYDAASGGNCIGFMTLPVPVIMNGAGITVKLLTANSDLSVSIVQSTT